MKDESSKRVEKIKGGTVDSGFNLPAKYVGNFKNGSQMKEK
ncbi:MAG TPA: hypothetical protein VMU83_23560 [Hanamia sp.]|nr:hypothetical protein [Hanamia sp.]